MAVKVYGTYHSPNFNRVVLVLHEKDVEFEFVRLNIAEREHKTPEYLALQPFGLLPLLQDGDVKVFESRAIMRYVADKYKDQGTPNLYGSTVAERAQVDQWLEVENGAFSPTALTLVREHLYKPVLYKTANDPEVVEEITAKLAKILDIYEVHLSKHKYLAGDFLSIADLTHLPAGHSYFTISGRQELLSTRKHVAAWWKEISSRPAWKKVVAIAGLDPESWLKAAESF
jgi:glutathione S-transferase